jgi:hypothetical protein
MASLAEVRTLLARQEELRKEVKQWSRATKKQLLFRLNSLNLRERKKIGDVKPLRKSLADTVTFRDRAVEKVAFSFVRHGIFLEHGVGKGRPVGSPQAKANAKKWLSEVIPEQFDELADIIQDQYGDIIEEELRLLIPGIVDLTTKPIPDSIDWVAEDGRVVKVLIDKSFF